MKIEIDLEAYDLLRNEVKWANEKIKKLEDQLKANEEREWEKKAIKLAHNLLDKYFTAIFTKLGFSQSGSWYRDDKSIQWSSYIGDKWYENEKNLTIDFSANVWKGVKNAYLNIGIITEPDIEKAATMLSEC